MGFLSGFRYISLVSHVGDSLVEAERVKSRLAISSETNYHGWTWIRDVNLNDVAATAAIRARSRRWHYRCSRSFLLLFSLYARAKDTCRPLHAQTSQRRLLSRAPFTSEHRFNQFASVTASLRVSRAHKGAAVVIRTCYLINHYRYKYIKIIC